jgi:hypothetical protein
MTFASNVDTASTDRCEFAPRPVNNRAKVSNGTRILAGIDGRSAEARRYRDVAQSLADDLGGAAKLSEAERALVRQAAASIVASEKFQAAIIRGDDVDLEQTTRLANATTRLLNQLARRAKARPAAPASPLAAHFARPPERGGVA